MCFRPPTAAKRENECPECRTVNPDEAGVCSSCGTTLSGLPPAAGTSGPKAPSTVAPPPSSGGARRNSPAVPKAPPKL